MLLPLKMSFEIVDRKLTTVSADCTYTWKEKCFLTTAKQEKKRCDFENVFLNYAEWN